ncbi:MAG TPA: DsbA family protein [Egibacteraceae bacterium]|nr:DsbA family protein [Egibacteraceae bacterium]
MSQTVTIYSDIHCPWATVAVHRLRRARDESGLDVVFDPRAWPLEWVNERGTPRHIVEPEAAVLANHEEELFSRFAGASWPSTFLPAFELVAAARRAVGPRAAEETDYQLRLRFFRHGADVSLRHELRAAAAAAATAGGFDAATVLKVWETEPVRADVVADFERSKGLPVQGSPQVFWPDGSTSHNPGFDDYEVVRGIPRIRASDPQEPARLLRATSAAGPGREPTGRPPR